MSKPTKEELKARAVLPDLTGKNVLLLSLKRQWFDLMLTGEKKEEYRKPSDYIKSRLETSEKANMEYSHILFYNGYGAHLPWFMAEAHGWDRSATSYSTACYSDGSHVDVEAGDYLIFLGQVVARGNLKQEQLALLSHV